jgi:hypothetical protein
MNENDFTTGRSAALEWLPVDEAVLVDDGWIALSMLVRIAPTPPPLLDVEVEALVDAGVGVVFSMTEVAVPGAEVVEMLTAPLLVPAAICDSLSAIAQSVEK